MKIGVELKIDVTKIDKSKLFSGNKGTYLDATVFIDLSIEDKFGNSGMITQKVGKDEDRGAILGNCRIFWREPGEQTEDRPERNQPNPTYGKANPVSDDFDDQIPF